MLLNIYFLKMYKIVDLEKFINIIYYYNKITDFNDIS